MSEKKNKEKPLRDLSKIFGDYGKYPPVVSTPMEFPDYVKTLNDAINNRNIEEVKRLLELEIEKLESGVGKFYGFDAKITANNLLSSDDKDIQKIAYEFFKFVLDPRVIKIQKKAQDAFDAECERKFQKTVKELREKIDA